MNTKRKPGCEPRWAWHGLPGPVLGDKLQLVYRERPKGQWAQPCIRPSSTHPPLLQTSKWGELGQARKAASGTEPPSRGQPQTCTPLHVLQAALA